MEILVVNGWELHATDLFQNKLQELVSEVESLIEQNVESCEGHPKYKLLMAIHDNIQNKIPKNPDDPKYRLGRTLDKAYSNWRRVKKNDLPDRYRLFFQFRSSAPKAIIYGWFNDESTLRKDGSKTDVYTVFEAMLKKGNPPTTWNELMKHTSPLAPLDDASSN